MTKFSITLIALVMIFTSCKTNKEASESVKVPYNVAKGYFLKNGADASKIKGNKIETDAEFQQFFGSATVMGANGKPTQINFSTDYVIPVVEAQTDYTTDLTPVSLSKNDDTVTLTYKHSVGEKQTFTTKPTLLLVVSKEHSGNVVLVKK